jgi:tagatose-6-phosphate ketose/aldose isomerase
MYLPSNLKSDVALPVGTFTYTEIFQQPELWPTTLEIARVSGWKRERPADRPALITGAGSSAYAASAIAASWPNAKALPTTDLLIESKDEIADGRYDFATSGLLVSIARSGDSPESVAVVNRIRSLNPRIQNLVITCNSDGQLAKMPGVDAIILDQRTNDRGLAMTSSFSNLALAGLSLQNHDELAELMPSLCRGVALRLPELNERAKRLTSEPIERVVVLGSGPLRALAAEAALKILEMTAGRTITLAETFLGLRHGPMSFVTPDTLVLCFFSSSRYRRRYEEDLVAQLKQKGLGRIVGIVPKGGDRSLADDSICDECIPASAGHIRDELRVPFEIPFAQLLAYHLSLTEGLDPDNPSPTGAITRVVQQFAIYDEASDV